MRSSMIEMVPINANGRTVYISTGLRGMHGFGATAPVLTTVTNVTGVVNAANAAIPQGKVTVQSDFSKVANVVATGAAVVAAATVWFPPAAIIAGVVSAAAALLGKIFANSKAKGYAAERGQYETVNAQLKYETSEMDQQYDRLYAAIQEMKGAVSSLSGIPMQSNGLGLCLWNCKDEKAKLQSAKEEYEVLVKQQEAKANLMIDLLNEYNKLMKELVNIKSAKSTKDVLLWIFAGAAALGVGYMIYKKKN